MIEVLIRIEQLTEKKIIDLFDWIVGTSTGGVIALGLVYGMLLCYLFPIPMSPLSDKDELLRTKSKVAGTSVALPIDG